MTDIKVTLGAEEYSVPPLDLGQIEDLLGLFEQHREASLDIGVQFSRALDIAAVCVRDASPPITDVRKLRGVSPKQMRDASAAIMKHGGLFPDQGEEQAAPEAA